MIRIGKGTRLDYKTTKLSYFTNTKDKISLLSQSSVVYKFVYPGCSSSYIGKTECTLWEKTEEHAYKNNNQKEQNVIYEHLLNLNITTISLIYLMLIIIYSTWISLISDKLEITQVLLTK